jgi:hypothetical protein
MACSSYDDKKVEAYQMFVMVYCIWELWCLWKVSVFGLVAISGVSEGTEQF